MGAGLLMSAAIFQMVLEAEKDIGLVLTMIAFALGAVIFTVADYIAEKKALGAIGVVSVHTNNLRTCRLILSPRDAIYYIHNSCSICRWHILHAIL